MLNNIHPIMLLVLWVRNSDTWKMARVSSVMSGASVGKIWTAGGWNHLGASALICLVPELSWLKDQVQLGLLTRVPTHDSFMRYTVGWPQIVRLLTELQEWVFRASRVSIPAKNKWKQEAPWNALTSYLCKSCSIIPTILWWLKLS